MRKIVLIQPSFGFPDEDVKPARSQIVFPYGLAHVATALLNAGHEVEVLDIYAHQWSRREVVEKIKDLRCDVIGITAMSSQYAYIKWLTEKLKERLQVKIVLGGLLSTYSAHTVLANTKMDICVIGEGEITMVDLMKNIDSPDKVPGVAYKENGQIRETGPRPYIKDIDSLPLPAYHLLPMDIYTQGKLYIDDPSTLIFVNRSLPKTMTVIAGRGCPYRCTFCSRSYSGVRLRSIDHIIEEIKYLKERYGVERIAFADELLVIGKKRAIELAEKIKPLGIKWDGQGRVNTVDYETLCKMKEAGCIGIGFGIESGSNKILKAINKGFTAEQAEIAMKSALRARLHVKVQLIMGYPGETEETVAETVELFKRVRHPGRRFALIVPLPGSSLYNEAVKTGIIKNEEDYLCRIKYGYGHEGFFINYMNMPRDEVVRLKREAEAAMFRNYMKYLIARPHLLIKYILWKAPYYIHIKWKNFSREPFLYTIRVLRSCVRAILPEWLYGLRARRTSG